MASVFPIWGLQLSADDIIFIIIILKQRTFLFHFFGLIGHDL